MTIWNNNEVPDVMLTWTRSPAQQGERQGQCLSNFRCSRWIMTLILYIVIIILSFIWSRIELASQKRSEHRAIVMLFCDIYVLLCMCVCVCMCMHTKSWYEAVLSRTTVNNHLKSCTGRVICFSASGVGSLLKFTLNPITIFWKLIHCWSRHLKIFSSFP